MVIQPPIILLVDDDPETLDILRRLLDTFTHAEVVAVNTGAAALAVIAARSVALVITDYHMPEMNGLQLTSRIKEVSPATRVAIISVDDPDDVERLANTVAAQYVLPKPFVLTQLKQMVAESLLVSARAPT